MKKTIKLTSLTKSSGCAAKIGPAVLDSVLNNLPKFENPNLEIIKLVMHINSTNCG